MPREKNQGASSGGTTPRDFAITPPAGTPDHSFTLQMVSQLLTAVGGLTEAVNTLKDGLQNQTSELREARSQIETELKEIRERIHGVNNRVTWIVAGAVIVSFLIGLGIGHVNWSQIFK